MFKVIKNKGRIVSAYRLGDSHPELDRLIAEGRIKVCGSGRYEIMSQEVVAAGSTAGQAASDGDYVKIDGMGFPYPNLADFFKANHRHISGDEYEQLPVPLDAWTPDEPMCDEVKFLIEHKGLVLNEDDEAHYYTAPLWGTVESAAKDSVLIFYSIDRDENGAVADATFNFVVRSEFDRTYSIYNG